LNLIEKFLVDNIFPDLEKGRPGWDLPHTKAVVYYMKQILHFHPELDPIIMIAAAYAHDWGYVGGFDTTRKASFQEVINKKKMHMEVGARKIEELLSKSDLFTSEQVEQISHLVSIHDKLKEVDTEAEIVLVEADTLGALDVDLVKPTFTKEENARYISLVLQKRFPLLRTEWSKDKFQELIEKRNNYLLK
jgi:hypothetical protein